jgi:hypothetical protein
MPFWKREDKYAIPAVEEPSSNRPGSIRSNVSTATNSSLPSYKSSASTYVPSRDGDLYNNSGYNRSNSGYGSNEKAGYGGGGGAPANDGQPPSDPYASRDPYSRNKPITDAYSRGEADLSQDRAELFSGYKPSGGGGGGSGRFFDGPQLSKQPVEGQEDDEDVEGIKTQTRFVKGESVNSTRNALRMAREAEETARNTLGRLGDQSEKLANTERHLDVSKGHSQRADDRTEELKQLNRSIFRPVITFNKDAKRAAQDAKVQARFEEERAERDRAMGDIRESQNRLGRAATYGRDVDDQDEESIMAAGGQRSMGSGRLRTAAQLDARREQRKRYQFEQDEEDDRLEDELDDNLDEIGEMTKRLKALGSAMGQELDNQNNRIERIEGKTTNLDGRIFRNTERLKKIK